MQEQKMLNCFFFIFIIFNNNVNKHVLMGEYSLGKAL